MNKWTANIVENVRNIRFLSHFAIHRFRISNINIKFTQYDDDDDDVLLLLLFSCANVYTSYRAYLDAYVYRHYSCLVKFIPSVNNIDPSCFSFYFSLTLSNSPPFCLQLRYFYSCALFVCSWWLLLSRMMWKSRAIP